MVREVYGVHPSTRGKGTAQKDEPVGQGFGPGNHPGTHPAQDGRGLDPLRARVRWLAGQRRTDGGVGPSLSGPGPSATPGRGRTRRRRPSPGPCPGLLGTTDGHVRPQQA